MAGFEPKFGGWKARVEQSFAAQPMMGLIGAGLSSVEPGVVQLQMPRTDGVLQQHGFFHGGAIATLADVAAGWAALSLMPEDVGVLTVEFKLNYLNPGRGSLISATGRVLKPGRTLCVVQTDVECTEEGSKLPVATGLFTMACKSGLHL